MGGTRNYCAVKNFGDFGAASSCDWSAVVLPLAAGASVSSVAALRAAAAVVHIAAVQSRLEILLCAVNESCEIDLVSSTPPT